MPNTTNYSFPTPADTDLVKNGADAIRDLGDAVDTAMNTALGTKKSGLVLLNTTSFSGVSTQSFNNVFSSTYDNYKVLITTDSNSDTDMAFRLRVGGADNSTASSYILQRTSGQSTTVSAIRQTNNYFAGINVFNADTNALDLTLYRPFLTKPTLLTAQTQYGLNSAINVSFAGQHNQSTSYDGFTFYGATFTGTISIYGFNK
jgi:hypothetical protein